MKILYCIFKTAHMQHLFENHFRPVIAVTRGHFVTSSLSAFCFANVCLRTHRPRNASIPRPPVRRQPLVQAFWSSPHPISNSQLRTLLHFHLCPIYLVVFKGVYSIRMGDLILRGASRLDAFSVYPFQAWLPGDALGSAAGTPAACPARSSRTKARSSQTSCARAG